MIDDTSGSEPNTRRGRGWGDLEGYGTVFGAGSVGRVIVAALASRH